jgi:DNA-binding NarL/FixJ family response regulator
MEPIPIVVADDHPLLRQGLKSMIQADPQFVVVAEAGDGETALKFIEQLRPPIAVLDINMPKLDGLAVTREIQRQRMETKVILITALEDEDLFREAIRLGCKGYLSKETSLVEILGALRAVRDGQLYVPPSLLALVIEKQPGPTGLQALYEQLTTAERRILRLIAAGLSSKEIANELSIQYKTVENHRTNISQKLAVNGPHALMRFALQHKTEL